MTKLSEYDVLIENKDGTIRQVIVFARLADEGLALEWLKNEQDEDFKEIALILAIVPTSLEDKFIVQDDDLKPRI